MNGLITARGIEHPLTTGQQIAYRQMTLITALIASVGDLQIQPIVFVGGDGQRRRSLFVRRFGTGQFGPATSRNFRAIGNGVFVDEPIQAMTVDKLTIGLDYR